MTFAGPGMFNVVVVAGSQTQPLTLEQAKPMIQRYLDNAKKRELAVVELKRLKTAAKIEYLGQFVDAGKHPAAEAPVETALEDTAGDAVK